MPIRQKSDVIFTEDRDPEVTVAEENLLKDKDYLDQLKFNEEPVRIMIARSAEKFAPSSHPVWCRGDGAEIFDPKASKWVRSTWIPIGIPVITRRKYVEILAGSKIDTIVTPEQKPGDELDDRVIRNTSANASVTILEDTNPRGEEWFRRLMYAN